MEFKQLIFTLDEGLYIINILRITTFSETGKKNQSNVSKD